MTASISFYDPDGILYRKWSGLYRIPLLYEFLTSSLKTQLKPFETKTRPLKGSIVLPRYRP